MAKKEERKHEEKKPITVECFGREFYASHPKGTRIDVAGNGEVTFEVGKTYRATWNGVKYEVGCLGWDTYKGERKICFAAFENGEWKGYLRTMAWAKLKAMANNPIDEPKKITPPPVKAEQKKEAPKVKAPKAPEMKEDTLEKRIAELEKELKATRKELDDVWKENERLKSTKKPTKAPEPKAEPKPTPKSDETPAAEVSLDTMRAWCEGKGLIASQKREGTCIWVEGDSKEYADELKEMGFRFAKKRKSWYLNPAA